MRSMLLRPSPATANGRAPGGGTRNGILTCLRYRTSPQLPALAPRCLDIRLSFALSFPRFGRGKTVLPLTKRQREILDYLNEFIQQHGYAPSLEEIGPRFSLSSRATVHKHLTNLQQKGCIKRAWNRSRSVEMIPARTGGRAVELPLLGFVAA